MFVDQLTALLAGLQLALAVRVISRWLLGIPGAALTPVGAAPPRAGRVSVVVPVLDEYRRLGPCLDGLVRQGDEVAEIVVVDGGSTDGTPALVHAYAADPRLRVIAADPVPAGWNGKAWGLQVGVACGRPSTEWVLTIDADVRPAPALVRSLLAHAIAQDVAVLSVATRQEVGRASLALLHPALLTTLVYRFGPPGRATRAVARVQANGQCFLARRAILAATGGFAVARDSRCEDVTVARNLAAHGHRVGFYEAGDLVATEMYASAGEAWRNWTRSLPMRDRFAPLASLLGLVEVTLVQALPIPVLALAAGRHPRPAAWAPLLAVNGLLAALRIGVLCGTARAYRRVAWPYWLSPVCDLPVAIALWRSVVRQHHVWRERVLVRGREL